MIEIERIDFDRLGFSALWKDYLNQKSSITTHFDYLPFNDDDLHNKAAKVDSIGFNRVALVDALKSYNKRFTTEIKVLDRIDLLKDDQTLTITTGQQLGVLGGPLFTLFKAISCVIAAEEAELKLGRKVLPVFWMADEDHDYHEIRSVNVIDDFNEAKSLKLHENHSNFAVADIKVHATIENIFEQLHYIFRLKPTAFQHIEKLKETYSSSRTHLEAFGSLMVSVVNSLGMIIAGSNDREIKKHLVNPLTKAISQSERLAESLEKQSILVEESGYKRQVKVTSSQLFLLDEEFGRIKLEKKEGGNWIDDHGRSYLTRDLVELVKTSPELFSPNVFLRPVLQDLLLPNIAYVAGPGELSYYAQTKQFYTSFDLSMPIIYPRISGTILSKSIQRKMTQVGWSLEMYKERDEQLEKRFSLQNLAMFNEPDFMQIKEETLSNLQHIRSESMNETKDMEMVFNRFESILEKEFNWLYNKYLNKIKRNNSIQLNRLHQVKSLTFPKGYLQERQLSFIYFYLAYGENLVQELYQAFRAQTDWNDHFILTINKTEALM